MAEANNMKKLMDLGKLYYFTNLNSWAIFKEIVAFFS